MIHKRKQRAEHPLKLYEWGIEALAELAEGEVAERDKVQSIQGRAIAGVQKQLDNLLDRPPRASFLKMSTRPKVSPSRPNSRSCKASKPIQWNALGGGMNLWLYAPDPLHANARFKDGDIGDKKEILLAIGQNPVLRDGKLLIEANPWLNPIKREASTAREQLEAVRAEPLQIQTASEEAMSLNWYRWSDSNRHELLLEGF